MAPRLSRGPCLRISRPVHFHHTTLALSRLLNLSQQFTTAFLAINTPESHQFSNDSYGQYRSDRVAHIDEQLGE